MQSSDDDLQQDAVDADRCDDPAEGGHVSPPFLFNMHPADGTHGLMLEPRAKKPPLRVILPDEAEEQPTLHRLSLVPAETEAEAEPRDPPAVPAAADSHVSVIEWAGGDPRAWRATLDPADAVQAHATSHALPVLPQDSTISTLPPEPPAQPQAQHWEKLADDARSTFASTDTAAASSLFRDRTAALPKTTPIVPQSNTPPKPLPPVPARLPWRVEAVRIARLWRKRIAAHVGKLLRSGPLADFQWRAMWTRAGQTAAGGIGFVLLLRTLLR